jgi:hypothetical protein
MLEAAVGQQGLVLVVLVKPVVAMVPSEKAMLEQPLLQIQVLVVVALVLMGRQPAVLVVLASSLFVIPTHITMLHLQLAHLPLQTPAAIKFTDGRAAARLPSKENLCLISMDFGLQDNNFRQLDKASGHPNPVLPRLERLRLVMLRQA